MRVAIGFDHAGFLLRETVLQAARDAGAQVIDVGTHAPEPVDFPDVAFKVGQLIQKSEADRGILVCGSGIGACIAANKMKGVYASVCHDTYSAAQGVMHDDLNVLCLGGRVIGPEMATALVGAFLRARYMGRDPGGERLERRVSKIRDLEEHRGL
ncbi:MAG TPA: ribose 5-phosphate isomerase B [Anaerolineales bacterium]|nr:ribose 5-phosphate isomerase B [Anaerolineales bacterium]